MPPRDEYSDRKIAFVSADSQRARSALRVLTGMYGQAEVAASDVVVAIGGDGFMLQTLRRGDLKDKPVFGMNRGTVGFLLNDYRTDTLHERLDQATTIRLHRLKMQCTDVFGNTQTAKAINEVALFRQSGQSARVSVNIDGINRLPELVCDGILVATAAGSTAYNLSVRGPIIPLDANLLALTPIAAFRPRRWSGALLPKSSKVSFQILDNKKRPVSVTADGLEFRNVTQVEVNAERKPSLKLLFDAGHSLQERIIQEQFNT